MQRVIRDPEASQDGLAALEGKVALIRQHFPPSVANLYAIPRQGSGGVLEWWSELTGQPLRYHELKPAEQQALLDKYRQRQESVTHLADALQARGQGNEALALRSLVGSPDLNNLYSLNGAPLVVRWGLAPRVAATPTPAPTAAPVPAPPRRLNLWPWLLGPLLLALLLGLLWWLWTSRAYWFGLFQRPEIVSYACQKDPQALPPEFAVVLDTSGSMNVNMDISKADEEWFMEIGQDLPEDNPRRQRLTSGLTRLDVAKQSFASMVGNLHGDIDMRLITFAGCDAQVDHGIFGQAQRPALVGGISALRARGGTPLASSLEEASSLVDGRERDAVIVMFIDGADGCEKDVCSVSKRIAREQPRLRVNVVNISDSDGSDCIADNTGGRVYAADNAEQVASMLREATEEVSQTASCK
ncbi:VWA domain-containing protein [Pseudomonas sp. L-22-4S-12]|uniref:VWA domain-containing protein n=1 Tax=Pseudomonas sp. L-22-4S-12 TaxID=2610893 RepID=UPI0013298056|nr:VWA domain-containing protein [Pseudomonas sp. L-22-4S-12]MWV14928.1 VWA domain-containing protein [Pseudomonas sp. L-22-4S-12]